MPVVFDRRLFLLSLIPRSPRSSSTKEIHAALVAEGYKISLRQTQKDLLSIHDNSNDLGLCYYLGDYRSNPPEFQEEYEEQDKNQRRYWYILRSAPLLEIPNMDPGAALALSLAERYLRELLPDVIFQNVDHYFQRARKVLAKASSSQRWLNSVAVVSKSLPLERPVILEEVATNVYKALQLGKQLRVKTRTRSSPDVAREYTINPISLVYRDPSVYLVWNAAEGDPKVKEFALHRMTEAVVLDDASKVPAQFSLDDFINESKGFGYFIKEELPYIDLVIETNPSLTLTLSETPLSGDQKIGPPDENGWSRITAHVAYTHQLTAWIREKGYDIKVIGPEPIRDLIIDQVRRMAANYSDV